MTLATAGFSPFPPELLLVLAASLLLWSRVHRVLLRLTVRCGEWGAFQAALALTRLLEWLPLTARMRTLLWREKLYAHSALGNTGTAVAGARRLAVHAKADGCTRCATCAVNVFINAGLYREALDLERGWKGPSEEAPSAERNEWALVRFNLVEAVYNLGSWEAASARLSTLEETARGFPFLWNFFPVQRAWILAHTGRGEEALAALENVDCRLVPRVYRSEVRFTRAAALLALCRYEEAEREARMGLKLARRASSTRNGLFLLGRIAMAAGRLEEALRFFEAGATHAYKGQGGDGLLAWGDCLGKLGRHEEAREAWQRVLARDTQSGAASKAASRLGLHEPRPAASG
ncbi:tetratricopeptide repeat protein [Archangium lansingense]|uniref:Tetratricopeptide repeat protein n=1 Tax=Archangium lansingense TaxID=2995310 RepID=A0ABT4A5D6_9BACT|nr:tetratricopeptide repeat protein [Archangium lansinium]MCY1076192.1 tetratricopeptide repeat protein [Archangium lansinium]